jgi:hypothetical protein
VQHSAEEINAFQALGVGVVAYLKILYADDVRRLCGREIPATEYAVALLGADGDPLCIRGTVAQCVLAAEESGLVIVPVQ